MVSLPQKSLFPHPGPMSVREALRCIAMADDFAEAVPVDIHCAETLNR